jgi:hypothetical protein
MKQDDRRPVTKKYLDESLEVVQKNLDKSLEVQQKRVDRSLGVMQKNLDESLDKVQKNILDGVGDIIATVVNHMDGRFDEVDDRFNGLERKADQTLDNHGVRIAKLEEKTA